MKRLMLIPIAFLLVGWGGFTFNNPAYVATFSAAQLPPSGGPEYHWPLLYNGVADAGGADFSPVTFIEYDGTGAVFDGTSYLEAMAPDIYATESWTFSFWYKLESSANVMQCPLALNGTWYYLVLNHTSYGDPWAALNGFPTGNLTGDAYCVPQDTNWHHIALSVTPTGVTFYIDAEIVFTGPNNTGPYGSASTWLGGWSGAPFYGHIKDFSIWTSKALTDEEVLADYYE